MFVRTRAGSIAVLQAQTAVHQFKTDFRQRYQIIEVTQDLIELAMSLAERHTIRGYDSVQLASALSLQRVRASLDLPTLTFVSADNRLNSVAEAESLLVENPNDKE
jgi:predicted nucleic acid-binding protein